MLRRAGFISSKRLCDMDRIGCASAAGHVLDAFHLFCPGVAERALRVRGATRDFEEAHTALLADLGPAPP